MHILKITLALAIIAQTVCAGDIEEPLVFKSPNRRWVVTARWNSSHHGYLFNLRDRSRGKTYFAQTTILDNEALPYRFLAIWNPAGNLVALNLYYGRIAQDVMIIDVSRKQPVLRPLFSSPSDFDGFQMSSLRWRNRTDLAVDAWYIPDLAEPARPAPHTSYSLTVRISARKSTIVKRIGYPP